VRHTAAYWRDYRKRKRAGFVFVPDPTPEPLRRSRTRFQSLLKRKGLTVEEFARMLLRSGIKCENPGCRRLIDLDGVPGSWGLDHDHGHCPGTCGCVKCIMGILCSGCNTALGLLGENGEKIRGLIAYLRHAPSRAGNKRRADSAANSVPTPLNYTAPKLVIH
jgi:hypothetical protein